MTIYNRDIFRKQIFSKDPDKIDEGMELLKLAKIRTIEDVFVEIGWDMITQRNWWSQINKHSYLTLYLLGLMHEFEVQWVVNLKELEVGDGDLTRLPDILGNLTGLTYLLVECSCTSIPDSLGNITNLTLGVAGSLVEKIPGNLFGVYLNKDQWDKLQNQVVAMTRLRFLGLMSNNLTEVPEIICNMKDLETLYLSDNPSIQIPDWMENFTNLTSLYLEGNEYTKIPDGIYKLTQLKHLDLSDNPIPQSEKSHLQTTLPNCDIHFD